MLLGAEFEVKLEMLEQYLSAFAAISKGFK
jgi:hypothetical protein